jgi:competence protein ComEA
MAHFSRNRIGFVACFCAMVLIAATASPQDASKDLLPNAPGKEVVVSKCTQCHEESRFALQKKSEDDWDQVITQMISNGLTLTDEEHGIALDYLAKNLGLSSVSAKVNVNNASAEDLQKTLLLTDKEAAAIVKYRTDYGAFKDWHEVASVEGVDSKKIEAKKDFLTF